MSWLLLVPAFALAGSDVNIHLSEGRQLYEAMQYQAAAAKLERGCAAPSGPPEQVQASCDLWARALAAQGNLAGAERAYGALLAKFPHAPGPVDAAPKVRAVFDAAKRRLYPPPYVRLEQVPSPAQAVALALVDPWAAVASVRLSTSVDGRAWTHGELVRRGDDATTQLPPFEHHLRWFVEASTADGAVVATLGTKVAPREVLRASAATVALRAEEPGATPPARHRALAWSLAGVAVVAAAGGGVAGWAAQRDATAAGDAHFASDTARLDRDARTKGLAANALLGASLAFAGGAAAAFFLEW